MVVIMIAAPQVYTSEGALLSSIAYPSFCTIFYDHGHTCAFSGPIFKFCDGPAVLVFTPVVVSLLGRLS